jgi:Protein of unknown function (DUF3300)
MINVKALLGFIIISAGGTVLSLAATLPKSELPKVIAAEKPTVETAPAPAQSEVQQQAKSELPATFKAQITELRSSSALPVIKVSAASKPAPLPPQNANILASDRQLDALLAPIALYPDQLLSKILMAATYPLEVIEAARWAARQENEGLQGERLSDALEQQDWDPSIKALVVFPHVLKMMDSDLKWMDELGDAFLDQETAVMDSVQRLRREARDADKLRSDEHRRVQIEDEQVIIEPANPEVVYVPFYDPRDAYGVWPYPDYPPSYIPPPLGYAYAPGVYYSFITVSPYWGWSSWDWRRRQIHIIDVPRYTYYNRGRLPIDRDRWQHDGNRDGGRGRDRSGNRTPQGGPPQGGSGGRSPGGLIVQQPNTPPVAPIFANRDPRRYRTPEANNGIAVEQGPGDQGRRARPPGQPDRLPNVTPQLPASVQVPPIAPPVSTPNLNTQQQSTPQLPAAMQQPEVTPPDQDNNRRRNFGRGDGTDEGNRGERQPRIQQQRQRQQQQQVFQPPPAIAPLGGVRVVNLPMWARMKAERRAIHGAATAADVH